jgi:hypothetical protein
MAADKTDGKDQKLGRQATTRLLSRLEAAAYLGVSAATLSRWAHERSGPCFVKMTDRARSAVRYRLEDLIDFVESRSRPTNS